MKKNQLLLSIGMLSIIFSQAQSVLSVAPGTDLFISSGTTFRAGGLSMVPSAGFTLNGATLDNNSTVTHTTANTYVTSVYKFTSNTAPFSGTIQYFYQDAELNGLNEAALQVNIHNGTNWQIFTSAANDATGNFVLTVPVSNVSLNELALSSGLFPLPLNWGVVSVYRRLQQVKIEWQTLQEYNTDHFSVERSKDAINWMTIKDNLPANNNTSSASQYEVTDNEYDPSRLFYRIKQTDRDGIVTYSMIAAVPEEKEANKLLVYPNPVTSNFVISNADPRLIKQIQLYTSGGVLVRTWNTVRASYPVNGLPAGIYEIRISLQNGTDRHFKINKR